MLQSDHLLAGVAPGTALRATLVTPGAAPRAPLVTPGAAIAAMARGPMSRAMRVFAYIGTGLSLIVLGAHFYRDGAWPLTVACVALLALLAVPKTWAVRVLQVALALGAVEWLWTAFLLVQERMALGRPWIRLAAILGAVALVAALSAVAVGRLRRR